MIYPHGKYSDGQVLTDNIHTDTLFRILDLLNHPIAENANICIMHNTKPNAERIEGLTMQITDKIPLELLSPDIGCGSYTCKLNTKIQDIDINYLNYIIQEHIPYGGTIRDIPSLLPISLQRMHCRNGLVDELIARNIGTLGEKHHDIRLCSDTHENAYLIIHAGSGILGRQVTLYYKKLARKHNIAYDGPSQFLCLTETDKDRYLEDQDNVIQFAKFNRMTIADTIATYLKTKIIYDFDTVHNYIDNEHAILRYHAVSAEPDNPFVIKISDSEHCLICRGKRSDIWNMSAPSEISMADDPKTKLWPALTITDTLKTVYAFKA